MRTHAIHLKSIILIVGIMFDLSLKKRISITAISFGFSTSEQVEYKVYWRNGSHKLHEVGSCWMHSVNSI